MDTTEPLIFDLGDTRLELFPDSRYGTGQYSPVTAPHVHAFPELFVALEGQTDLYGDFGVRRLSPRHICLMPKGVFHATLADATYERIALPIICRPLGKKEGQPATYGKLAQVLFGTTPLVLPFRQSLLQDMYRELTRPSPLQREKIKSGLSLLFIRVIEAVDAPMPQPPVPFTRKTPYYERLIQLDNSFSRYAEGKITWEDYCASLYLTPRQVSRIIEREYAVNTTALRKETRMRQALFRLQHTSCSVGTLAEELGYASAESFSLSFKRRFGVPPGTVKKNKT